MRPFYTAAAAFNLLVGAPIVLAPRLVYHIAGMAAPASLLEARMLGAFIILFGVLYWIIGQRDGADAPLLGLAVAGKGSAFALTVGHWLLAGSPLLFALLGLADLAFGLYFLAELSRVRRRAEPA